MKLNFICGGAPKSGTTTLYNILKEHPDIYLSSYKEPMFFNNDAHYIKGIDWYYRTYFNNYSEEKIISDFSPAYLANPLTAGRIELNCGNDVKFLFIVRNPVNRSYSQYLHSKRDLNEDLPFIEALNKEEQRMKLYKETNNFNLILKHGYIKESLYFENIKRYIDIFGRENIKVLIFEEMVANMQDTISDILYFLNINTGVELNMNTKSNSSSVPRLMLIKKIMRKDSFVKRVVKRMFSVKKRQKIRQNIHRLNNKPYKYDMIKGQEYQMIFNKYFKDDIMRLETLLNIDLDQWKASRN